MAESRTGKIAQAEALALAPEDLLLHLCYHTAYQHTFGHGLRGLTDIAYVVRRFEATLNWDEIAGRARAARIAAPVYLAVRLAVVLLSTPVPPVVLETLRPVGFDDQAVSIGKELLFADQNIINTITPDLALSTNNLSFFQWVKGCSRAYIPAERYHGKDLPCKTRFTQDILLLPVSVSRFMDALCAGGLGAFSR